MKADGVLITAYGEWWIFPCECNLPADTMLASPKRSNYEGLYPKPVETTFRTDYVLELRPQEVEVRE